METPEKTNANNAVQILAKAAEAYLNSLTDEMSKSFTVPQVNASLQIFAGLVAEKFPEGDSVPAAANDEAEETPAKS